MAHKYITAILWTLVSVNSITLVLGGLITWLGYAIPIRLKQFGLAPELAQAAGFASLLVACLGLCALNYSSHYALNVYGFACVIFAVLMIFGTIPEEWSLDQRAVAAAAHQHRQAQAAKTLSLAGGTVQTTNNINSSSSSSTTAPNNHNANHNSSSAISLGSSSATALGIASNKTRLNHNNNNNNHHHHQDGLEMDDSGAAGTGGILLDLIYFSLLALLVTLLLFAFALAQYLRRKETEGPPDLVASGELDGFNLSADEREWERALGACPEQTTLCTCGALQEPNQPMCYQQPPFNVAAYGQYSQSNIINKSSGHIMNQSKASSSRRLQPQRAVGVQLPQQTYQFRQPTTQQIPIFTTRQQQQQQQQASHSGQSYTANTGSANLRRRVNQGSFPPATALLDNYSRPGERRPARRLKSFARDQEQDESASRGRLVHKGFYLSGGGGAGGSVSQENIHKTLSETDRGEQTDVEGTDNCDAHKKAHHTMSKSNEHLKTSEIQLRAQVDHGDDDDDEEEEEEENFFVGEEDFHAHAAELDATNNIKSERLQADTGALALSLEPSGINHPTICDLSVTNNSLHSKSGGRTASDRRLPNVKPFMLPQQHTACRCLFPTRTPVAAALNRENAQDLPTFNPLVGAGVGIEDNTAIPNYAGSRYPPYCYCTMPRLNSSSVYAIRSTTNSKLNQRQQQQHQQHQQFNRNRPKSSAGSSVMAMTAAAAAALLGGVTGAGLFGGQGGAEMDNLDGVVDSNIQEGLLNEPMMGDSDLLSHHHQQSSQIYLGQYDLDNGLYSRNP